MTVPAAVSSIKGVAEKTIAERREGAISRNKSEDLPLSYIISAGLQVKLSYIFSIVPVVYKQYKHYVEYYSKDFFTEDSHIPFPGIVFCRMYEMGLFRNRGGF